MERTSIEHVLFFVHSAGVNLTCQAQCRLMQPCRMPDGRRSCGMSVASYDVSAFCSSFPVGVHVSYPWEVLDDLAAHVRRVLTAFLRDAALERVGCAVPVVSSAVGVGVEEDGSDSQNKEGRKHHHPKGERVRPLGRSGPTGQQLVWVCPSPLWPSVSLPCRWLCWPFFGVVSIFSVPGASFSFRCVGSPRPPWAPVSWFVCSFFLAKSSLITAIPNVQWCSTSVM